MREPHWADDIPPPHAPLYTLGQRCLDAVNKTARAHPPSTSLEHGLLEIGRSQALAIEKLATELLRLRQTYYRHDSQTRCSSTASEPSQNRLSPDDSVADLFADAVQLVRSQHNGSTSWLQRKLRISYSHAERLMDEMERAGVVTAVDQLGRRSVLAADD